MQRAAAILHTADLPRNAFSVHVRAAMFIKHICVSDVGGDGQISFISSAA